MGKTPKTPDPYQTAQAQAGANFQTAQQNAVMQNANEYTPYGSKTYKQIGFDPVYDAQGRVSYAPRYQSEIQLSPDQQRLLGQQTGIQYNLGNLGLSQSSRLQDLLGHEMSTSGLQSWQTAPTQSNYRQDQAPTDRAAIEQAMMSRYNQDAAKQAASQDAQLAARGLNVGSQGYGDVQQQRDRARTDALQQAYLGSGAESRAAQNAYNQVEQAKYGERMNEANFGNQLRQAQFQETTALRNQPINEIMALMGGSGVTTPQFSPFQGGNVQGTNLGQMIYDSANMQAQNQAAANSGLFGIGANIAGALPWASWLSDRRLKTDIKPLHKLLAGVPLYSFRYKRHKVVPAHLHGTLHIGVMADECREIHPDAVRRYGDGYDRVDYDLLNERHELEAA